MLSSPHENIETFQFNERRGKQVTEGLQNWESAGQIRDSLENQSFCPNFAWIHSVHPESFPRKNGSRKPPSCSGP